MGVFSKGIAFRRRGFFFMTLLAIVLTITMGGILWYSIEISSLAAIQTRVALIKPLFTSIRLLLIALVAILWPFITNGLYHWGKIDTVQQVTLNALRWRIVIWLVVIELVLGQNLIGQILRILQENRV
jgi:hypothetical protein